MRDFYTMWTKWVGTRTPNILQTSYLHAALAGTVVEGAGAAVAHLQVELDVDHVGARVDRLDEWEGFNRKSSA